MTGSAAFVSAGGAIGVGSVVVVVDVVVVEVVVEVVVVVLVVVEGAMEVVVVDNAVATSSMLSEQALVSMALPTQSTPIVSVKRRDIDISLPALQATRLPSGDRRQYMQVFQYLGTTIRQAEGSQADRSQSQLLDGRGGVGTE